MKTGRVDPSEDNMLKITSEGRKAALDLRLMKPAAPDEPQGKVNLAVEKIFNIWQESQAGAFRAACVLRPLHAERQGLLRL